MAPPPLLVCCESKRIPVGRGSSSPATNDMSGRCRQKPPGWGQSEQPPEEAQADGAKHTQKPGGPVVVGVGPPRPAVKWLHTLGNTEHCPLAPGPRSRPGGARPLMCCAPPGTAPTPAGAAGSARTEEGGRRGALLGAGAGVAAGRSPRLPGGQTYLAVEVSADGLLRPGLVVELGPPLLFGVPHHVRHHLPGRRGSSPVRAPRGPTLLSGAHAGGSHKLTRLAGALRGDPWGGSAPGGTPPPAGAPPPAAPKGPPAPPRKPLLGARRHAMLTLSRRGGGPLELRLVTLGSCDFSWGGGGQHCCPQPSTLGICPPCSHQVCHWVLSLSLSLSLPLT